MAEDSKRLVFTLDRESGMAKEGLMTLKRVRGRYLFVFAHDEV